MLTNIAKWFIAALCAILAACAIITVNVYFPEKDVKQAYKSLDEMLLKQKEEGKAPAEEKLPAGEEKKEEVKPQSRLLDGGLDFPLVPAAFADENIADQLAIELSSMPEVLKAYDEMKARLPQLDAQRDSGAVGESRQGIISVRDAAKLGGNKALVDAENNNRKTVITAMAKAILKINKQPETKANLNQVLGKAAASYATTRQDQAKPGWWLELPNGRWVQK
ncbi:MAG: hypothetical protein FD174_2957 [Geobacteraceae bacterium]|nr:MAG: hypothetical protein FD174_2957 [Geobacteraceae bacterium]